MKGKLILEDGTLFEGKLFGAMKQVRGEVVFNTGMTGYQELLTDPSYVNQMVVLTYPLVGNYGFNWEDVESASPKVNALIVKELCRTPSHFRSVGQLEHYLKEHGITGIEGIDTRALTIHIREKGMMRGALVAGDEMPDQQWLTAPLPDPVASVTTTQVKTLGNPEGTRIAVLDFGIKGAIVKHLINRGMCVSLYPAQTTAKEMLAFQPSGILLSNGPGNPKDLPAAIKTVNDLLKMDIPLMGICLGHQLLNLACGGDVYKLPFGHRGGNHPVKHLETGAVTITSQNHSYAVKEECLPDCLTVTHRNLNDGTVEGIRHRQKPVFSVQYHPEASPGPADSVALFDTFQQMVEESLQKEEKPCH
ncbi:carbamoyl phosphate synthase small subunit [Anoxynatronum buryatiense]|uniref:Carbamoyl phosphate synthase small chain n=1 Tax=Anoxynatronum buryatiense TaxID=489973 RepID=A0AA46AHY4_9CLOT|nr:carbamoyl phosphate synthase small subunit [Anoxynatronum buryatiense]SMP44456.1 carbamoyl-phosphate synthase small subunit [Anoxynatronum buryatiense]